eukprot:s637_g34.t1
MCCCGMRFGSISFLDKLKCRVASYFSAMGCSASQPQQRPMPAFKMDIKSEGQLAGQHCFDAAAAQKQIDKLENEAIGQNPAP